MITQIFRIAKIEWRESKGEGKLNRPSIFVLLFSIFFLSTLYFLLSTSVYAESVSSMNLINSAKEYDGKNVEYTGEVIGDVMVRADYAWVNVHDGKNAIGIWVNKTLISEITFTGEYKSRGDTVRVSGIFNRACSEHGGDLDIHAQTLSKVTVGSKITHPLDKDKRNLSVLLIGILILIFIIGRPYL